MSKKLKYPSIPIGFRLDYENLKKIEKEAHEANKSRNKMLNEMVRAYCRR